MKELLQTLLTLLILTPICSSVFAQEKLEVEGAIIIGNSEDLNPREGTIRYNPTTQDFEGWNGSWISLTQLSQLSGGNKVFDIDGNQYFTVTIGTQTWMRENLRTTRYRNGDTIPEAQLDSEWGSVLGGAWCWYNNDHEKDIPYGKLYTFRTTEYPGGLCPTGWHVASIDEWATLIEFLGGEDVAGGKMKSTGTVEAGTGYWMSPNSGATNESGFSGVPAGIRRRMDSSFDKLGQEIFWWTSTGLSNGARIIHLTYSSNEAQLATELNEGLGASIRCIKD